MGRAKTSVVVLSDIHAGSRYSVCPPTVKLDDGGIYKASSLQVKLYNKWKRFWDRVFSLTYKPIVILNGDILEGRPSRHSFNEISLNLADQVKIAKDLFEPIRNRFGNLYIVRGTSAHAGSEAESEERLGMLLGATAVNKQFSRYCLELCVGKYMINAMHHIGTTSRTYRETAALMAEAAEIISQKSLWKKRIPDIIIRSHRHSYIELRMPTRSKIIIAFTTPGWQVATNYVYRHSSRVRVPQIGGVVLNFSDSVDVIPFVETI